MVVERTSSEIKAALKEAGLEVYRTTESAVHIAERPRENLIMDSNVCLRTDLTVVFVARAERATFPHDGDAALFARVRDHLSAATEAGFTETEAYVTDVTAPSDASLLLDRWYQVRFEKQTPSFETAIATVRAALELDKIAKR